MRRAYQATSVIWFVVSIVVLLETRRLTYYTPIGPGAGFFLFWVGIALAVLSVVWFGHVSFGPVDPVEEGLIPDRVGIVRIVLLLVALVLFTVLLTPLGFRPAMLGFLIFALLVLGRQSLLLTMPIAVAGSFGTHYVFEEWLGVHLPTSSMWFLQDMGL